MKSLRPNYGGKYLEQCPKITVKGLFGRIDKQIRKELEKMHLDGIEIIYTKANYGGYRKWFKCPSCKQKTFTLYHLNNILICRKCTGLDYRKQRYRGMIEEKVYKQK